MEEATIFMPVSQAFRAQCNTRFNNTCSLINVHPAISGAFGEAVAIIFMLERYSLKEPHLTLTFCCFSESEGRPSLSSGG